MVGLSSSELRGVGLQPLPEGHLLGFSSPLTSCSMEPFKTTSSARFCWWGFSSMFSIPISSPARGRNKERKGICIHARGKGKEILPDPSPGGRHQQQGCPTARSDARLEDGGEKMKGRANSSSPAWVSRSISSSSQPPPQSGQGLGMGNPVWGRGNKL